MSKRRLHERSHDPEPCFDGNGDGDGEESAGSEDNPFRQPPSHMPPLQTAKEELPSNASRKKRLKQPNDHHKGLRHFGLRVCRKVEEKGHTSYNEVADEIVSDEIAQQVTDNRNSEVLDVKNIRRRVYDALNILMALDIISKERKEIRWKGMPKNLSNELDVLKRERTVLQRNVRAKHELLKDRLSKLVCMHNLHKKNALSLYSDGAKIPTPFIVLASSPSSTVQCEISSDSCACMFEISSDSFEIHDDTEILKRLHFDRCTVEAASEFVPTSLLCEIFPDAAQEISKYSTTSNSGHNQTLEALETECVLALPKLHHTPQQHGSLAQL